MADKDKRNVSILEEEKPVIEFPQLVLLGIIFISFCFGIGLVILPWYITLGLFIVLCFIFGVIVDPYVGLLIFVFGSIFHPAQLIGGSMGVFRWSRYLAFLMLFAWLFHILIYRDFKLVKTAQNLVVISFFVLIFCSVLKNPEESFFYFAELSKLIILYFMTINLIRTKKRFIFIIWFLMALMFISGIIGIYQWTHNIGSYDQGVLRITGTTIDPNNYAMHIVMTLPLFVTFFFATKKVILKFFLVSASVILTLNIIFTYSRGGFIGLAVIAFLLVLVLVLQKRIKIPVLILIIIFIIGGLSFLPPKYWERIASISNLREGSISSRLEALRAGLEMIGDHPFGGVGLGIFQYEYAMRAQADVAFKVKIPRVAHNTYVQTAAEGGIPVFLLFIALIFFSLKDTLAAKKIFQKKGDHILADSCQSLAIALVGYIVCGIFLSELFLTIFWVIAPLCTVAKSISSEAHKV